MQEQSHAIGPKDCNALKIVTTEEKEAEVGVVSFRVKECYLYSIPPASSIGHRAELWGVDNWIKALSLQVISTGDAGYVRLFDLESGELFAECPLPQDHRKLHTAVEPVIDSSRYFSLRIVDRDTARHAFVGIGFRERGQASDFAAALDDHRAFLRRKAEAARIAEEREAREAIGGEGPQKDMSIQGTIHLNLKKLDLGSSSKGSTGSRRLPLGKAANPAAPGAVIPPPPSAPGGGDAQSGFWKESGNEPGFPPPHDAGEDDWSDFQG